MPSKIWLLADQGHHGVDPFWMIQAGQSTVQRIADVAKPIPPLQGVTASAHAARYFGKLRTCNTFVCWQVISRARHLRRLAQAACNFFASLTFIDLLQSVSDMIVSYEEAQPEQALLFRDVRSEILCNLLLCF